MQVRFICIYTSKRIELGSPTCSGFEAFSSKPKQPGLSTSICLDVVCNCKCFFAHRHSSLYLCFSPRMQPFNKVFIRLSVCLSSISMSLSIPIRCTEVPELHDVVPPKSIAPHLQPKRLEQIGSNCRWNPLLTIPSGSPRPSFS